MNVQSPAPLIYVVVEVKGGEGVSVKSTVKLNVNLLNIIKNETPLGEDVVSESKGLNTKKPNLNYDIPSFTLCLSTINGKNV